MPIDISLTERDPLSSNVTTWAAGGFKDPLLGLSMKLGMCTLVLKHKISGLTRACRGEAFIVCCCSVVESYRRQGGDALDLLQQAMQARFAGSNAPTLCPSG